MKILQLTAYIQVRKINNLKIKDIYLKIKLGVIDTEIWRHIPFPINILYSFVRKFFLKTLEEGIQTSLYCIMSPDLENVTGKYFRDCKEGQPRSDVYKREWQTALWNASKLIVNLNENDTKI